jgi:hypothetical protein
MDVQNLPFDRHRENWQSSGSSPQDYYVGPEIPGTVIVPPNGYKDSSGRVLRQAARFRIYGWENGVFMGEITSSVADITWTVELANTKAAFNRFTSCQPPPLRLARSLSLASDFGVLRQIGFEQANFRVARDASAAGNGKQSKARGADTEPHGYCERPVL